MKSLLFVVGALPAVALVASTQAGVTSGIDVQVYAAAAPNVYGSASWAPWRDNALFALRNGFASYGGSFTDTPTAYERSGDAAGIGDMCVTSFASWRGSSTPSGAFAAEYGTRMHFGLAAVGTGGFQFSLNDLSFNMHGDGADWASGLDYAGTYAGYTYTANRIGVLAGADGVLNTADDVVINSGAATQLVDAFYMVGVGNAWWPADAAELADMNQWGGYTLTTDYTFTTAAGNFYGSDSVYAIPAPGALVLLGLAGVSRRRRR